MYSVMRNIAHLCSRKSSQTWGPDAWKKVRLFTLSFYYIAYLITRLGGRMHRR